MKKGYKQTDVGVIPEEWEVCYLRDISRQITDGDHLTPKREREGYYLLSARNVRDGRVDLSDVDYVGIDEYRRMRSRCAPEPGDLFVSCSGHGLGRVSLVPDGLECVLVRSAALIKLDYKQVSSHFIQYWLQGAHAQNQISTSKSRAAQPNLFLNSIARLRCALPATIEEQRAIAAALGDVDALITGLEELLRKKRDVKQATMQQLLTGKQRLPGFRGGSKFKKTDVGPVPEDWEVRSLHEIGAFTVGKGLLKENIKPSGSIPAVPYTALYTDFTEILNYDHIKWFIDDESQSYIVNEPCVLIASSSNMAANTGKATALTGTMRIAIGREVIIFSSPHSCSFISLLLSTPPYRRKTLALARGTTIKHLYPATFRDYTIALPPLPEQTAIATVLSDMDAEIVALEKRLEKTRALKQGMMQELLTGRTRLG